MRVVAGEARGRRLSAALPRHVRPTTDMVREAIFGSLEARFGVEGTAVCDLYCGSGAMGIEALSRGAASCTFVDDDPACLRAARTNLEAVGLGERAATFVRASLPGWRPEAPVGIVCCDPPYGDVDAAALLEGVVARVVVIESDHELVAPPGWESSGVHRYGGTLVTMLTPALGGVA